MSEWRERASRLRPTWARVLSLGWPVMVQQVTRTLMRTTDVFITAQFSPAAVVAIGLAELYTGFSLRIGLGLGGAAIALSSQDTGRADASDAGGRADAVEDAPDEAAAARDEAAARAVADRAEAVGQALLLGLLLGVPLALAGWRYGEPLIALLGAAPEVVELGGTYLAIVLATAPARHVGIIGGRALQGAGDTRTPMYANVAANVLNIVGSLVLGFGLFGAPALRVVGVALATAGANVLVAVLVVAAIVVPRSSPGLARPRNPVIARQLVAVATPRTAEGFGVALARFPFNALLLTFGTEVNAGYQIGKRVYQQVTAPLSRGYSIAASILVGQSLGRGDPAEARFTGWAIAALGVATVGVLGLGILVGAEPLVRLFTDDPAAVTQSTGFARAYGLAATPFVVFSALSGALQGAGETRLPFYARVTGTFGFLLGFSYLAGSVLGFGPLGAYAGVGLSYAWMGLVIGWSFHRSDWAARAERLMAERAESG